jgi:hypothetical protein
LLFEIRRLRQLPGELEGHGPCHLPFGFQAESLAFFDLSKEAVFSAACPRCAKIEVANLPPPIFESSRFFDFFRLPVSGGDFVVRRLNSAAEKNKEHRNLRIRSPRSSEILEKLQFRRRSFRRDAKGVRTTQGHGKFYNVAPL